MWYLISYIVLYSNGFKHNPVIQNLTFYYITLRLPSSFLRFAVHFCCYSHHAGAHGNFLLLRNWLGAHWSLFPIASLSQLSLAPHNYYSTANYCDFNFYKSSLWVRSCGAWVFLYVLFWSSVPSVLSQMAILCYLWLYFIPLYTCTIVSLSFFYVSVFFLLCTKLTDTGIFLNPSFTSNPICFSMQTKHTLMISFGPWESDISNYMGPSERTIVKTEITLRYLSYQSRCFVSSELLLVFCLHKRWLW